MKTVKILLLMAISTLMSCAYGMDAILAQFDAAGDNVELKIAAYKAANGKLKDATAPQLVTLCAKFGIARFSFTGKTPDNLAIFREYVSAQLDLAIEQEAAKKVSTAVVIAYRKSTEIVEAERAIAESRTREERLVAAVQLKFQEMQKFVTSALKAQADHQRACTQLKKETRSLDDQLSAKDAEIKVLHEALAKLHGALAESGKSLEEFAQGDA